MSRVTKSRKKLFSQQQPAAPQAENLDIPGLFLGTFCSLDVDSTSWEYIY